MEQSRFRIMYVHMRVYVCRHVFADMHLCMHSETGGHLVCFSSGDTNLIGFFKRIYFILCDWVFRLVYMCTLCAPAEARRGCWILWTWSWDGDPMSLGPIAPESKEACPWLHFPKLADHQEGWLHLPNPKCYQGPGLQYTGDDCVARGRTRSGIAPFPSFSGL